MITKRVWHLAIFIGVMAFASYSAFAATTYTETVNGITWTYTVENGCASVGGGSSSSPAIPKSTSGAITIPAILGGYEVANIGSYAFDGCSGMTSVTIPDGVTSIGDGAFAECFGLTSVTIGVGVACIGYSAFYRCYSLGDIAVEKGNQNFMSEYGLLLSKDGKRLVQGVNGGSVLIPGSVTSIGEGAFGGCWGLETVLIPYSVTSIGEGAFSDCFGLSSVTIPDSVTEIGDRAFSGCLGLMSVTIPDSVTSIGEDAFSDCGMLPSVTIPDSVTNIGVSVFSGCSGLTNITIPNSVTSIGAGAFSGCSGLTNITIPNSVTSVGAGAFSGCSGLTNITIPNSVTSVGAGAFSGCSGLQEVTIPFVGSSRGNSGGVAALFGYIFGTSSYAGGRSAKQYYSSSSSSTFYIPSALRRVIITDELSFGYGAFSYCSGLTNITFSSTLTSIGPAAFRSCGGLTSVTIPSSVASIGNQAFDGCSRLANVHVADMASWCKISFGNYYSNPLVYANKLYMNGRLVTNLEIPSSVTTIGDFAFCKCSGLTSVTIPNTVTHIGAYAFRNCAGLTSITIPNSVTSIGNDAFYSCSKLMSVEIGSSVISIGESAFENCTKLENVTISDSVTSIGSSAFSSCSGLTNITIGCGVTSIGISAFIGCSGLASVTIPNSVTSIGPSAFSGCSGLTSFIVDEDNENYKSVSGLLLTKDGQTLIAGVKGEVTIPNSVTSIGSDAFSGCSGLTSVTIPDSVTSIGPSAFSGCSGLTNVLLEGNAPMMGSPVFASVSRCCAYVRRASSGWGVEIPGKWAGIAIDYIHYDILFDANGGGCMTSTISIADGATIEAMPIPTREGWLFLGWFTAADDGVEVDDEFVVTGEMTLYAHWRMLSLEEALDCGVGVSVETADAVSWWAILDPSAQVGNMTARSGAIGNRTNTWLSATVEGAGTLSFWCKVSCEHDEDNTFEWDRLMIYTNEVEIAEWRMDGETDWMERTLSFGGGTNTVKWVYYKDRTGADGEDCAWVDAVVWTPSAAADPIPAVAVDADAATVNAAVDGVGFADTAVKAAIGGSATEYNAFKTWADGVKGTAGDALAGEAAVVANEHAAAAYLLGSERLFENEPTIEIGGLAIAEGESAGTTTMTVAVTVKDGESAVAVTAAKVAAMFEATGDLGDWSGAAKLTPTVTTSGTDASGKMTFVVTPGDGTAAKAFLRIRK